MRHHLAAFLGLTFAASPSMATNNYFLPGDAFFSVAISQSDILSWTASTSENLDLAYSRFDGEFYACGNIGYSKLSVLGFTADHRSALAEAYWRFAESQRPVYREEGDDGQSSLEQINSVVALIYHKDFDMRHALGLKFNEDWVAQGGGHYSGLFTTSKPVMLDWKYASEVAPLAVQERLDPKAHLTSSYEVAHTIDEPLHIDADDIMIVLVGFAAQEGYVAQRCPELQSILDHERGAQYMVVTESQVRIFFCEDNGNFAESTITIPVSPHASRIPEKPLSPPSQ
ncbi:MAG TPA: hypothetical protein PLA50_17355 [Bacteroidia bacterium]|nr:hypothetical protein [Bacteroidia bacterium]